MKQGDIPSLVERLTKVLGEQDKPGVSNISLAPAFARELLDALSQLKDAVGGGEREGHTLDASGLICSCHARFSTRWEAAEHATGTMTGPPTYTPKAASSYDGDAARFQARVEPWLVECFGVEIASDKVERNDRFVEESLELVQSLGYTVDRAHALVDYVFGRPVGEPSQEVGGVMVTLAALCLASDLDMATAGETELARICQPEIVAKIRAKQAAKPTGSALPLAALPTSDASERLREFDPLLDGEAIGSIREIAKSVTGGNCAFADDDVRLLGKLAILAIDANLHTGVVTDRRTLASLERAKSERLSNNEVSDAK